MLHTATLSSPPLLALPAIDAIAFVRHRLDDARVDALANEDINIEFHAFDWRLNDRRAAPA